MGRTVIGRSLRIGCFVVGLFLVAPLQPLELRAQGACTPQTVMSPGGNSDGGLTSVSGDGRYMAFSSQATDLVPNDTNGVGDIFVYDRVTCAVERVSVNSLEEQATGESLAGFISDDGRYVAFASHANNLGPIPDTNGVMDAFVRDRQAGVTLHASPSSTGGASNGQGTHDLGLSGNGQFVAFWSSATNLIGNDTNGQQDLFIRDLLSDTTTRVSVATAGVQSSGADTVFSLPSLSNDGRYVAFASQKADLVSSDTNAASDIFRHDRQTGITARVSVATGGGQATGVSNRAAISGDGRYVAFQSAATNLVASDTNNTNDVFVHDTALNATSRASLVSRGGESNGGSVEPSISGDGRYVAFASAATNLVVGDTNGRTDIFVHDRTTTITRLVSASAGGLPGNNQSEMAELSDDGVFVGFASMATNLTGVDPNGTALDAFVTNWPAVSSPSGVNLLRNGDFSSAFSNWGTFALPEPDDIVWDTTGGVLQFYRETGSSQAVVLQSTGGQLLPFAPVTATFDLGNTSAGRKRISVLIHDGDFSDLSVCTFWLDAGAPMRTYLMRMHTTRLWSDATISFYAATADSTGYYRVDNVSFFYNPAAADSGTDCVDPTAPAPAAGAPGANLLTNGDFSGGLLPWGTFGQIVWQIVGGVFEFHRPAGTPAGVVLQGTGQAMTNDQILTASLSLGNSSSVRKRVTLLLHDGDFTDLAACTFWVPPSTPLSAYSMRMFTSKAWSNATLSVYAATIGTEEWFRLDDVVVQRTPATVNAGTECLEPDFSLMAADRPPGGGRVVVGTPRTTRRAVTVDRTGSRGAGDGGPLPFAVQFWLAPHDSPVEIQVSSDGETWRVVATLEASEEWTLVGVDTEQMFHVRVR